MKTILLCLALIGIAFPAQAETINREAVEKHLQSMTDLYNTKPVDPKKIHDFIESYFDKDAVYKSTTYVNDEKEPIVETKTTAQILKDAEDINEIYLDASAKYEILDYKPNADNSHAEVKYQLWHKAKMEREVSAVETGIIEFEIESVCTEDFSLDGTQVKSHACTCETKVKNAPPVVKLKDGSAEKQP